MPRPQNIVQETTDYDQFSVITSNRDTNRAHIERLKKSFEDNGNLTRVQPVLVNEHFQIVDGQHRFYAAKEMDLPIYFTIVPGIGIHQARQMNLLHRAWGPLDYLKTYTAEGKRPYIQFGQLMEDYPELSFSLLLAYTQGSDRSGAQAEFRRGELDMFDVRATRDRLDKLMELAEVSKVFLSRAYAQAFLRSQGLDRFDFNRLKSVMQEHQASLVAYVAVPDALRLFEQYYNYNRGIDARLRFF